MTSQLTSTITQQYQQQIAPRGSALYYSVLYNTPAQRQAIIFVHGLYQTLRRTILNCNELAATKMKLQWWRQQIDKLYQGNAEHPIAQVLQHYVAPFHLPAELFVSMIDATEHYLDSAPLQTLQQRQHYLAMTAGAREQLTLRILEETLALETVQQIAAALEMVQQITHCPEALQHGYHFFSLEELNNYNLTVAELEQGNMSDTMQQFFQKQCTTAQQYFANIEMLPATLAIRCRIGQALLKKLAQNNFSPFTQTITVTPLYQLYTAWRHRPRRSLKSP
ncbi:MAG: squalene/phytoene synthase family protein [Gammaproteobacteria bacterium]|nr:squalene/phytoene synthase family protein [Gammaproteobacteria bacterium]